MQMTEGKTEGCPEPPLKTSMFRLLKHRKIAGFTPILILFMTIARTYKSFLFYPSK